MRTERQGAHGRQGDRGVDFRVRPDLVRAPTAHTSFGPRAAGSVKAP